MKINLPYDKGTITTEIDESVFKGFIVPNSEIVLRDSYLHTQEDLIRNSLENPIDSKRLAELAKGKQTIVVISSDHTQSVPSKSIMPLILAEIRRGNPEADITILIATGTKHEVTNQELIAKFGENIVHNEKLVVHDSRDKNQLSKIGTLPSGSICEINKLAKQADLLVAEGSIEPHFFAGYSGGRNAVFPGVAGYISVLGSHNGASIASPKAHIGNLEENPIHIDMLEAAKLAKLAFIVNVVLDHDKRIVKCVSGDPVTAHLEGTEFVDKMMSTEPIVSDITITSNGGFPLDQNIYQSVKGITGAEATNREGGVIIMAAAAKDGHGGEEFYQAFKNCHQIEDIYNDALKTSVEETISDQWQSQLLARVMMHHTVIFVTEDENRKIINEMKMFFASTLEEAIDMAKKIVADEQATIAVIPEGVSTIIKRAV